MSEKTGYVMAPETWIGRTRLQSRCTTAVTLPRGQSRRGQSGSTSLDASEKDRRALSSSLQQMRGVPGSVVRRADPTKLQDLSHSTSEDDITSIAPSLGDMEDLHPLGAQLDVEVGSQAVVADQQKRIEELENQLSSSHSEIVRLRTLALEAPSPEIVPGIHVAATPAAPKLASPMLVSVKPTPEPTTLVERYAPNVPSKTPNRQSPHVPLKSTVLPAKPAAADPAASAAATTSTPAQSAAQAQPSKTSSRFQTNLNQADEGNKSTCRYWTPDEHSRFLEGVEKYGYKDIKAISRHVETRNATQVRTHAQKYYLRLAREANKANNGHNPVEALQNPVTQPSVDSHSGNPVPKAALEAAREQAAKLAAKGGSSGRPAESQPLDDCVSYPSASAGPSMTSETKKATRHRKEDEQLPRKRLKSRSGSPLSTSRSRTHSEIDLVDLDQDEVVLSDFDTKEDDETDQSTSVAHKWHVENEPEPSACHGNLLRSKSMQTIISLLSSNPTGGMGGVDSEGAELELFEGETDLRGLTVPSDSEERGLYLEHLTSLPLNVDMPDMIDVGDISAKISA